MEAALRAALTGRYDVEGEIGRGGMATVYLAHDCRHRRRVALKVLDRSLGESMSSERFLREIRVTASFTHPHLVPLYDSGEAAGQLYYVMPYVEGETLRARLARVGALAVGRDAAAARRPTRWRTPTARGWFTGTSSRRTCCSRTTMRWWSTSASRAPCGALARQHRRGRVGTGNPDGARNVVGYAGLHGA